MAAVRSVRNYDYSQLTTDGWQTVYDYGYDTYLTESDITSWASDYIGFTYICVMAVPSASTTTAALMACAELTAVVVETGDTGTAIKHNGVRAPRETRAPPLPPLTPVRIG